MDYTRLSLAECAVALEKIARDARATFADLGAEQLNLRPDEGHWSVAQCFQHLLTANSLMMRSAGDALTHPRSSIWQRVPLLPSLFGRALIRSQSPTSTGKYSAPANARPTSSDIAADIISCFSTQQCEIAEWMRTIDERNAARRIMTSPFIRFVTYSVLDGCRLIVAHDRRHFEQARRVIARFEESHAR